jgi:nucleotidyltransferase AbiEii toxin of type IV toxin-antitoxin system
LTEIDAAMRRIGDAILAGIPGAAVNRSAPRGETRITKLIVRADEVQIKIEVTPVLRGGVYDPERRSVAAKVEEEFGFAEMQVVSFPDLYAGKIVAALDRQHPRDLFDVRDLLANEGISDELRRAFIIYLVSTNRPFAELLEPTRLDIAEEFARGFEGMTNEAVTLDELLKAREQMIAEVVGNMPMDHRKFLVAFKRGEPDWKLLEIYFVCGVDAALFVERGRKFDFGTVLSLDGLRSRAQLGHRSSKRPEIVNHCLIDEDVAVSKEQDAFLAARLPQPPDNLECSVGLPSASCHDQQHAILPFGDGFDRGIDRIGLVVTRSLAAAVIEVIL